MRKTKIKQSLRDQFRDRDFRRSYCEAHIRHFLAAQFRALRGKKTQDQTAKLFGATQTVVSRLEDPYHNLTLKTLQEFANKYDRALVVKLVSFDEFIRTTGDFSDKTLTATNK